MIQRSVNFVVTRYIVNRRKKCFEWEYFKYDVDQLKTQGDGQEIYISSFWFLRLNKAVVKEKNNIFDVIKAV